MKNSIIHPHNHSYYSVAIMVNINETKDTIEITLSSSDDHEEEEDNDERLDDALPSTLIPPAISSLSNSSTLLSLTSSSSLNDDDDDDDETPNSSNERSSDLLLFEESNLVENTSATCPASVHLWLLESGLMTTMKNTVKSITSTAAPNNNRCSEEYDKGCNKQKEGEEPHVTNAMNNTTRTNSSTTSEERSFRSDQSNSHTFSSAEIACELNTLTARTSTHTTRCNGQDETGTMSNKKLGFNMITFQKQNKLKACSFFAMIKSYLSSSFLTKNLLPDDKIHIFSFQIFESIPAFRIFKFVIVTFLLLIAMYFLARLQVVNWEHDESYTPMTFVREDMNDVIVDTIAFAVVGRLYKRRGVDRLFPFIIPMVRRSSSSSSSNDGERTQNVSFAK